MNNIHVLQDKKITVRKKFLIKKINIMKKTILLCVLSALVGNNYAQKETFDLITYTPLNGWTKDEKKNVIGYSKIDKKTKTWCQIGVYRSTTSKGSIEKDIESEWKDLAVKQYNITDTMQVTGTKKADEWEIKTASGKFTFNNQPAAVLLTTFSGYNRCVSIIATTNSQRFLETIENFVRDIDVKKPNSTNNSNSNQTIQQTKNPPIVSNGNFSFSTSNFDDGWTSAVHEDWVEVSKGSVKVLLHYPKEGTIFPADPEPLTNAAWNILVAPRYSNLKNYKTTYISTFNRPYLGMGYAVDNGSGKKVFVVLYRQGDSGWIEFICSDKNSFMQEFKFDPETVQWDTNSDMMNTLYKMKSYNKFAIAASDFIGKWTSDFTGIQQMYQVYTGQYAGMNIHQSNEEFIFNGNNYSWKLLAINGMIGNTKYDQVASSGTFTVPNNWQIIFSKIEKRQKTYNAFWSCIKGARVLNLLDAQYPGSGIYNQFGLSNK